MRTIFILLIAMATCYAICIRDSLAAPLIPAEANRLGERMYREGLLPSGKPMEVGGQGDVKRDSTAFACVSCHLRSGIGSFEGGVLTIPANGRALYKARGVAGRPERIMGMNKGGVKIETISPPPLSARPAYTDESLAVAIRSGKDPAGRLLNETVMPRYNLSDSDMSHLITYLKNLSNEYSPGVDRKHLRLATITSEGIPPAEMAAMLGPLENFVESSNSMEKQYRNNARKMRTSFESMPFRRLQLSHWQLKGPTTTWRQQLEEYYRKEPVFALVGGLVSGDWKPVHEFCETNKIPCILPVTDFPVVSATDWYTLYLSKGYYQEGESAARYLNNLEDLSVDTEIVQLVQATRAGEALSAGFGTTWQELGHKVPRTVTLQDGGVLSREYLQALLRSEHPVILMLWTGPEHLSALEHITALEPAPRAIFVSYGYLGKNIRSIKEAARAVTHITYPYRMPQDEAKYASDIKRLKKLNNIKDEQLTTLVKTYYAIGVLSQAIKNMSDNYYRDYLLDVISMQSDIESPLYERLIFGTDQRYVSQGCYVVQLAKGENPEFIRKSDWVIH